MWRQPLAPLYTAATIQWCCHRVLLSHTGTPLLTVLRTLTSLTDMLLCHSVHVHIFAHSAKCAGVAWNTCGLWGVSFKQYSLHSLRPAFFHSVCVLGCGRLRACVLVAREWYSSSCTRRTGPDSQHLILLLVKRFDLIIKVYKLNEQSRRKAISVARRRLRPPR